MADDLSSFIEQQKSKLEKERAELTRDGNYNITSQERQERKSPKGIEIGQGNIVQQISKPTSNRNEETGLQLGGYAKHQEKLKEERKQEYIKFLAEKQLRTTGKVDVPVLKEKDVSPITNAVQNQQSSGRRSTQRQYEKGDLSPPPRNRRRGKENFENIDDYVDGRGSRQHHARESYEDLLRRKRADERRYRGADGIDIDDELRQMRLASKNYKSNSRSDGFLSRRYDDDYDDDDEFGYDRRSRRRKWNVESKRVRFHDYDDDDNVNDRYWSRPRHQLENDYDDNDDDYLFDAIDKLKRQSRREGRRRNSAHEERTVNRQPAADDTIRRTKTDNEIRSNSAPLPEGAGIIGSHIETREMKLKKQEKYKRELEEQMKLQESNKKKEKVERMGAPGESPGNYMDTDRQQVQNQSQTPRKPRQPALKQSHYNTPVTDNYGPSSRPPQHQSLYPSPYDDPYYYYGTQERGSRTPALQDPLFKSPGFGAAGPYDTEPRSDPSLDLYQDRQERKKKVGFSPEQPAISPRGGHVHQPPGGTSNLGGVAAIGQGTQQVEDKQSKRAAMQAYQEELRKQMEIKEQQKKKEKEELERYNKKIEDEVEKYNPWGKGGGGAPLRDVATGQVIADLRGVNKDNADGRKSANLQFNSPTVLDANQVSPRSNYQSPHPPTYQQQQNYQQPATYQQTGNAGVSNASLYGRSDPLKERQPNDDLKEKAKQEYQQYLRQQVEEKERKKKEEQDRIKAEEEKEERRLQEQRDKMQKEFLEEQEKIRKKEEEVKRQNEALLEAQNEKKREAERKRKEMEDKRQEELRKKLEDDMAAKKAAVAGNFRSDSPPIPTMRKQTNNSDQRGTSPPVPALAGKQNNDSSVQPVKPSSPALPSRMQSVTSVRSQSDNDVLSQLTALRQQLKNEEHKVQSQIGHTNVASKYSQISRVDNNSRRSARDVFDRALTNKPATTGRKADTDYSAAEEFNRIKQEETSSLAGEFRSRFPQPATTDSMLDLQQQEYLREQEDKISSLRAGKPRHPNAIAGPSRSKSKDSLLESDSQFIAVDEPAVPESQIDVQPRLPSARERRRWKQLEEMAKEPKPYDTYKPPTPGGFSLNSVTSFNVDEVASKNEERLKRLHAIQRAGGAGGSHSNPDDVLKQFMSERGRPVTRTSETSLEAESSYEPVLNY